MLGVWKPIGLNTLMGLDLEIMLNEINLLINSFPKRDLKTRSDMQFAHVTGKFVNPPFSKSKPFIFQQ